jgi:hypothetical protein
VLIQTAQAWLVLPMCGWIVYDQDFLLRDVESYLKQKTSAIYQEIGRKILMASSKEKKRKT